MDESVGMSSLKGMAFETINVITSAFDGVSREGGVSLHETRVLDDSLDARGSDAELIEARAKDTDVRWQDVPDSAIEKPDLNLSFLDPIGFRYYIPTYMIWFIKQLSGEEGVYCDTHSAALFFLTPNEWGRVRKSKLSYFEILTQEQSHAIYRFLRFCTEYGDEFDKEMAQQAIDKYWGQFR